MSPKSPGRSGRNAAKFLGQPPASQDDKTTVVAIGASAGGIEALTDLMSHVPVDTGMAFVLVQHLDPKHHSLLTELLARKTAMTVTEVSNGLQVKPNHVYVIPPNASMSISDHTLHLGPREEGRGLHMSVMSLRCYLSESRIENGLLRQALFLSGTRARKLILRPALPRGGSGTARSLRAEAQKESELLAGCPSPRERQILYLLADGKSNKEIGVVLEISTRTVEFYRARIMLKLDLHSTAALVRYAIRNNIVEA